MSFLAYTVPQLADELGVHQQTIRDRIERGAMPEGVTTSKIGLNHVIYIPAGKRIARTIDGVPVPAHVSRPGQSVEWRLIDK